jgi:hypothetical protein
MPIAAFASKFLEVLQSGAVSSPNVVSPKRLVLSRTA